MRTVCFEPVLGSNGSFFVFLGLGKGALATVLHFRFFQLTTMVNCLLTQLQPQRIVIVVDA
jgi:hypothetical protein